MGKCCSRSLSWGTPPPRPPPRPPGDRVSSSWKPPHRKTLIPMYRPVPALSLPRPDKTEHRLDKTCAENSLAHTLQEPCIGLSPMPAATRVPHARAPKRGGSSVGG